MSNDFNRSNRSGGGRNNNADKPRSYNQKDGDKPRTYGDKSRTYGKPDGDKPRAYGDKPRTYGDKPNGYAPKGGGKPYDRRKPYDQDRRTPSADVEREPLAQQGGEDEAPFLIIGRNAVRAAVKTERSIDRILYAPDPDGPVREILSLANERKLVTRETDRKKLDELCMPLGHGGKTGNHQGIVAYAAGVEYCDVADILAVAKERGELPFVIVLDGIMDPHNLGSIIRSADCAGAHGVIIGKRRSASVTAATVKAAAGACEHVKIARVVNISAAINELKRAGLWIVGADMEGRSMDEQSLKGAMAIVIGSEGEGMRRLVSESCDFLVSIPIGGHVGSLNASVAAAVLMFEKKRQDRTV